MLDGQLLTGEAELSGAVAGTVVGQQDTDADAVGGEELHRRVEKGDGGFSFLIRQHLGEGHAGVVVNRHVQGQEAGMTALAAQRPSPRSETSLKRTQDFSFASCLTTEVVGSHLSPRSGWSTVCPTVRTHERVS